MPQAPVAAVPAYVGFDLEVAAVRRLSPNFVRITLTGEELVDFRDGAELGPRDTRIKLVIPARTSRPTADIDYSEDGWYGNWLALDPQVRGHLRTYSVREWRAGTNRPELDIDFVLHLDEEGRGGPATVWADRAVPGDRVTVIGPHRLSDPLSGIAWCPPPATSKAPTRVLLGGDETAAPAIASILRTLPDAYYGNAFVEVPSAADMQSVSAPPGVEVTWLIRSGQPRGALLRHALNHAVSGSPVREEPAELPDVDVDADILWETPEPDGVSHDGAAVEHQLYAWIAGEAGVVREIRRDLVTTHGVPRSNVAFMGFWREGRAEG
jgi:iron complex transport system ATP-binding protein